MNYTIPSLDFSLPHQAFSFDPLSLYALLCQLPDQRGLRRRRYRQIAPMLLIYILAKLCAENHPPQIADWAKQRGPQLVTALRLAYPKMLHPTTWRFWLQRAVNAQQFSQLVSQFFTQAVLHTRSYQRGSLVLAIDGKLMRHAIPADRDAGLHLARR